MTAAPFPLATLADIQKPVPYSLIGGPFGSKLVQKDYEPDGVPVIRGVNLPNDRRFAFADFVFVSPDKVDRDLRANRAFPGDIVVTQRGTLGQVGLIPRDSPFEEFVLSQSQMKLTVDDSQADADFVYYALTSPPGQHEIISRALTAGVPHINLGIFGEVRIPLPSLPIQRKVAAVLSAYDALIENNRRRITLLEEIAQRIYHEWFVNFRYPGHQGVSLVDAPGGPLPAGWHRASVADVSANFDRQRKPLSGIDRAQRPGPYPYYGAARIFDYIDDYLFDGAYLLVAEDGSVITPDGVPVTQYVTGKFWANNHTHILQGRAVSTEFLAATLRNQPISGYVTGAAQPKITQANLNRIPVLVPSADVAQLFDAHVKPLFSLRQLLKAQSIKLRESRDRVLPKLVSGQIDVEDLDITVEAAA